MVQKSFVASLFYGPMSFFAKASILLLYYRAFGAERWMKWSIYVFMVIMFAAYWMTGEPKGQISLRGSDS